MTTEKAQPRVWLGAAAVVFMAIAGSACGRAQPESGTPEPEGQRIESLRGVVLELIGDREATSIAQCRLIAFGAKPCGGPRSFLVYSVEATDSIELARAVEAFNAEDDRLNKELGRASDCLVVTPPQVSFASGVCGVEGLD